MTKKRYRKLARAYFTGLNEWAKVNRPNDTLNMGDLYARVAKLDNPIGMTRAEWWENLSKGYTFGVGVKKNKAEQHP